jgi:ankyrin repeat protein
MVAIWNDVRLAARSLRHATGFTLLAVQNGHFELALVDAGADPNDRRSGFTPLDTLTRSDVPLMRLLLELSADPLLPNFNNTTPLMMAAGLETSDGQAGRE